MTTCVQFSSALMVPLWPLCHRSHSSRLPKYSCWRPWKWTKSMISGFKFIQYLFLAKIKYLFGWNNQILTKSYDEITDVKLHRHFGQHKRHMITWKLSMVMTHINKQLFCYIFLYLRCVVQAKNERRDKVKKQMWCKKESRSTLAQVMYFCLTAPSHYQNQFWLRVSEVLWHSPHSNFTENTRDIYRWIEFEIC